VQIVGADKAVALSKATRAQVKDVVIVDGKSITKVKPANLQFFDSTKNEVRIIAAPGKKGEGTRIITVPAKGVKAAAEPIIVTAQTKGDSKSSRIVTTTSDSVVISQPVTATNVQAQPVKVDGQGIVLTTTPVKAVTTINGANVVFTTPVKLQTTNVIAPATVTTGAITVETKPSQTVNYQGVVSGQNQTVNGTGKVSYVTSSGTYRVQLDSIKGAAQVGKPVYLQYDKANKAYKAVAGYTVQTTKPLNVKYSVQTSSAKNGEWIIYRDNKPYRVIGAKDGKTFDLYQKLGTTAKGSTNSPEYRIIDGDLYKLVKRGVKKAPEIKLDKPAADPTDRTNDHGVLDPTSN